MTETKTFRTLNDVINATAGESLDTIAAIAAPLERIITGTGLMVLIVKRMEADEDTDWAQLGADVVSAILRGLSDYMPDVVQVLAIANGVTVEQLKTQYTGLEVIKMAKDMVRDEAFLSSVRTLAE